ncbi:hypothetical protein [Streptomyces eurocidicus]|uniref:Uncharacterized protein n=1 Tax=Streptomyces eurocidicus TaxID=66423 RepID=A0A7W8B5B9_STREU|nr:hypothetical protein [Streptomyces eurocidicus]MBB5116618.1 hypothetical protein [Streptomyces eurocidicus]MBF6052380.1 hypothetical protein [Streptomyces eurocidicus]
MALSKKQRRIRNIGLPIVVCMGILAGLHITFNTNTFGPDRPCNGLVSAQDMQDAAGGSGRLSSRQHPASIGHDENEFTCTTRVKNSLPGRNNITIDIRAEDTATADFPFSIPNWGHTTPDMAYFNGGGVSDTNGWVLLPEKCWSSKSRSNPRNSAVRRVVTINIADGHGDSLKVARLLTNAANSVAEKSGCASPETPVPSELQLPAKPRQAEPGAACALPGFKLPETISSEVLTPWESRTQDFSSTWLCHLSKENEGTPFTSFAVSQDPRLVASLAQAVGTGKVGTGWQARGHIGKVVANCAGKETFFGMNSYAAGWTNAEHERLLPDDRALFVSFVKAASEKLGCAKITP